MDHFFKFIAFSCLSFLASGFNLPAKDLLVEYKFNELTIHSDDLLLQLAGGLLCKEYAGYLLSAETLQARRDGNEEALQRLFLTNIAEQLTGSLFLGETHVEFLGIKANINAENFFIHPDRFDIAGNQLRFHIMRISADEISLGYQFSDIACQISLRKK